MEKPILFLDFDGTLADTINDIELVLQNVFGFTPEDIKPAGTYGEPQWKIASRRIGRTIDEDGFWHMFNEHYFTCHDSHLSVMAIPGAQEAIKELAKHFELHIVTARAMAGKQVIHTVADRLFSGCFLSENIHCVWDADEHGKFVGTSKGMYISNIPQYRRAGFIDDSPTEIANMLECGVLSRGLHLFDPMQQHTATGLPALHTWKQIAEYFLRSM